ncbi:flavin-containing monooxygenase [Thermoleophilum album]|uniref:Predicted flavoprotein CzcO associated with the cation diffusion facilitator CzcD n=1 Tax=Thermoleophilum album TaxID=29539 RepID=A0A1H6FM84_THEAL|nr:NAD(P)/FAD-dependent oxidoreductase [Thermoleophilum album]SEH10943.1 Predicted flavoprotein CzcO associated with the cation diffusion facilitator CzcD [Thermoleophilum album]
MTAEPRDITADDASVAGLPIRTEPTALDFDAIIIGAGVSGIGAAYYLQKHHPAKRYAILEARQEVGGTWDLFRYPGIRSDSDLHTFGYEFKPWTDDKAIADGPAIKAYIEETAREYGIDRHIRFGHKVVAARWSSATASWTLEVERVADGERFELTCRWLFGATGYYRYDRGHEPYFEGRERFRGTIIHPQFWPEDFDYTGKRVVVIGSGATAVTLVPAMTDRAAHVVMLQRSPTYILPLPARDAIANRLRKVIGEERAYKLVRYKNVLRQLGFYAFCRRFPNAARKLIRWVNARALRGTDCDVDVHFNPSYDPWDQRLCVVPDGDLYQAIRAGKASIVTDRIKRFTETGIELESGRHLEADVIVTATGLELVTFGGIAVSVDGETRPPGETVVYKGSMLADVPNFAFAIGYTNASWTLKVDLVWDHYCRLIRWVEQRGYDAVVPRLPKAGIELQPLLDFKANYVLRALDRLPKQGKRAPWYLAMNYFKDRRYLRKGPVADDALELFTARGISDVRESAGGAARAAAEPAAAVAEVAA